MNTPFLAGLHEKPFFLTPETYDLMVYPAEWMGEAFLDINLIQELSDVFYHRTYGRRVIYNLWTLFVKRAFLHWFEDDAALGYRNLITDCIPEEMPSIFYNASFTELQLAKLKELRTDIEIFRKDLSGDYIAVPLIPAALAIGNVSSFELGEAKDPLQMTSLLEDLKNFLN
jgi:hypothetical protein